MKKALLRVFLLGLLFAGACSTFDRKRFEHDVEMAVTAGDTSLGYHVLTATEVAQLHADDRVAIVREDPRGRLTILRATDVRVTADSIDPVLRRKRSDQLAERRAGRMESTLYSGRAPGSTDRELMLVGRILFIADNDEHVEMPLSTIDYVVLQTGPDPTDVSIAGEQLLIGLLFVGGLFLIGFGILILLAVLNA